MKLIFIFFSLFGLTVPLPNLKFHKATDPKHNYQLQDKQIIKQMAEPIEITNQASNLLRSSAYQSEAQLVLPSEDLEYIRSNGVPINLSFAFQFEWWNTIEHQIMQHPQIVQSLKSADLIRNPSQVIMRLNWPSDYLQPDRPFAHAITFSYNQDFDLVMKQQLITDLADWEINAIANEVTGAPKNYRIRLTNLQLSYPVPPIFYNLQTKFIEVPTFYSHNDWTQWWNEFNQLFLISDFLSLDHFDDFFLRPKAEDQDQNIWSQPKHGETAYLNLNLTYQNYNYLKIYQYFFDQPKLKIIYHQYLDLTFEFNQTDLVIGSNQNYWTAFRQKYTKWTWWLDQYVEPILNQKTLILKSKNLNLVRGEAEIKIIETKISLNELSLQSNFSYLQIDNQDLLKQKIFNLFKDKNLVVFGNENFKNYQIIPTTNQREFTLKALDQATFSGSLNLNFKEIKVVVKIKDLPTPKTSKKKFYWPFWNWILLAISLFCLLVLILLKFIKSKPTQN